MMSMRRSWWRPDAPPHPHVTAVISDGTAMATLEQLSFHAGAALLTIGVSTPSTAAQTTECVGSEIPNKPWRPSSSCDGVEAMGVTAGLDCCGLERPAAVRRLCPGAPGGWGVTILDVYYWITQIHR